MLSSTLTASTLTARARGFRGSSASMSSTAPRGTLVLVGDSDLRGEGVERREAKGGKRGAAGWATQNGIPEGVKPAIIHRLNGLHRLSTSWRRIRHRRPQPRPCPHRAPPAETRFPFTVAPIGAKIVLTTLRWPNWIRHRPTKPGIAGSNPARSASQHASAVARIQHRRGGRAAEGAPLLREYGSKAHRGFESLPLRHILFIKF